MTRSEWENAYDREMGNTIRVNTSDARMLAMIEESIANALAEFIFKLGE